MLSGWRARFSVAGFALSALAGSAGATVTIGSAPTQNLACTAGVCVPTAATAVLNVKQLQNLLANGNVTVTTGKGTLAKKAKNILVNAPFSWASPNSLTLSARDAITIHAAIGVAGPGAVTLSGARPSSSVKGT